MEGNPFQNFELDRFEVNYTIDDIWLYVLAKDNFLILIDQLKTRYYLHCYIDDQFHMSMTGNFTKIIDSVKTFLLQSR